LEGNVGQVAVQIYGVVVTIVWSSVASAAILLVINKVIGLRVDKDDEARGLDLSQHGETLR
jgi:Amt family ammonium transporter